MALPVRCSRAPRGPAKKGSAAALEGDGVGAGRGDVFRGQAVSLVQLGAVAGHAEFILHPDPQHRHRQTLCQRLADGGAQSAHDVVVLGRDDGAGLGRRQGQHLLVDGFDGVEVQHPGRDPAPFQQGGGVQRDLQYL